MRKKVLSFLIALLMIITFIIPQSGIAFAQDNNGNYEEGQAVVINPLYEGVVDEADLVQPDNNGLETYSITPTYTTYRAAGEYISECMENREETIELTFVPAAGETYGSGETYEQLFNSGFDVEYDTDGTKGDSLMWVWGGYGVSYRGNYSGGYTYIYTVTYYTTKAQEDELVVAIDNALDEMNLEGKSDYQKTKIMHDYILEHVTYDYTHLNDDKYTLKQTAYAGLINGTCVCSGYAILFYKFCRLEDIDVRVITGMGNGGYHAWNIVQIGDYFYNVDTTWDDGGWGYTYFLKCEANFTDHVRDDELKTAAFNARYPMCFADYSEDSYIIRYDGNGASSGNMSGAIYKYGTTYNLSGNTYARDNYKFTGWNTKADGTGTAYTDKQQINLLSTDNVPSTLYAQWKKTTYTITYNLNGGVNNSANLNKYVSGTAVTLRNPTKTGYTFGGWYTNSSFKGNRVTAINVNSKSNIVLYAKWTDIRYTITYKLNGGKNSKSNLSYYYTSNPTRTLSNPTRTGYKFAGWYTNKSFKGSKVTSIKIKSIGNVVLYAKWTPITYTVKFNGNRATKGSMSKMTSVKYGSSYRLKTNKFTRKGYVFTGWNTKSNGKGKKIKNKAAIKNLTTRNKGTVTLYAIWKKK